MSVELLKSVRDLNSQMEMIGNSLKTVIAREHVNQENSTIGFIEYDESEPIHMAKSMLRFNKSMPRKRFRLPTGYQRQFKSLNEFLQVGYRNKGEFETRHRKAIDMLVKANALNGYESDSAGALVLPEFAPDIATLFYDNDILSRTNQFTIAGNRMSFPKLLEDSREDGKRGGGLQGFWLEENDPPTGTKPRVGSTELKLGRAVVIVYLSEELLEDASYALETFVRQGVQSELNFLSGDAIFNGPGGNLPLGFLNSTAKIVVSKEGSQAAKTILPQNILNMWSRRRANAPVDSYVWFINQEAEPQLHSMVMGAGGNNGVVYLPPGGLSAAPYATLMGRPVIPTEFNQALGEVGDIALVNLSNYLTITKGGVNEVSSPHVEFLRSQLAIKFTFRMDGRPLYDRAIKPKYGSATQSDFIVLEARK